MPLFRNLVAGLVALGVAACAGSPPPAPTSATAPAVTGATATRPPVILISVDGMRADYLRRGVTPKITALAAAGVRAAAMRPSFPSLTFPNHYTFVTGLRPDHHGVVNNNMEAADIPGVRFSLGNRLAVIDRRWWDAAEPAWVTAEKAGIATATMFWPGSEAAIQGVRPAHWAVFDGSLPGDARVDTLLGWLAGPDHPGFATLYFDLVDHEGHESGPESRAVNEAARSVDASIGRLIAGLKQRGIVANIIIVADHGMAATAPERIVRLDTLLPAGSFRLVAAGPVAGIVPNAGAEIMLAKALLAPHDHMQCWRKAEIPQRLGYGTNPRVPPFVCLAETGWLILGSAPRAPMQRGGAHGYDPMAPEMAAMFVATGPAFRAGVVLPAFDNVDVYPLVMHLLGLPPLANDGSLASLQPALR
jgi:predicted AlkP superfamily pyrophosphatase or phosphodiesterase